MDNREFAVFAAKMQTYFPKEGLLNTQQAIESWYEMLNDIPYPTAMAVLKQWVTNNEWSPTIADIRKLSTNMRVGEPQPWEDGWKRLLCAIRKYGYMREKEILASLDDVTRKCVDVIGLQSICAAEESEQAYRRKEFKEIYERMATGITEYERLPEGLKNQMAALKQHEGKEKLLNGGNAG